MSRDAEQDRWAWVMVPQPLGSTCSRRWYGTLWVNLVAVVIRYSGVSHGGVEEKPMRIRFSSYQEFRHVDR
jgi:hypothetical protein